MPASAFAFGTSFPPSVTVASVSPASRSVPPPRRIAYTASAVDAVELQFCVCFCLSIHARQASTLSASSVTSKNASMITACVETGAAKRLEEKKLPRFQYMPISSETIAFSFSEAMTSFATSFFPKRCSTRAARACVSKPKSVHSSATCLRRRSFVFASASGTPGNECRYSHCTSQPQTRNGTFRRFASATRRWTSTTTSVSSARHALAKKSGYAAPARRLRRAKPVRM